MIHGAVFWSDTAHPAWIEDPLAKVEGHAETFPAALSRRNRPSTAPNFAEIQTMGRNGRETFPSLHAIPPDALSAEYFPAGQFRGNDGTHSLDAVYGACGARPPIVGAFQRAQPRYQQSHLRVSARARRSTQQTTRFELPHLYSQSAQEKRLNSRSLSFQIDALPLIRR